MVRQRKITPPAMTVVQAEKQHEDGLVEVVCITHNVHLGDGRELDWQEATRVAPDLADFLEKRGQVKRK